MKKLLLLFLLCLTVSAHARTGLLDSLGLNNDVPLDVDVAFVFSAQTSDTQTVLARWNVAEGNYLYRNKMRFELLNNENVRLLPFSLPSGENKMDEIFGLSEVYPSDIDVILPIERGKEAQQFTLKAYYQGCSETFHICYPPTEKSIVLTLAAMAEVNESKVDTNTTFYEQSTLPEQDRIAQKLAQDSLVKILIGFFGFGLLLAFTPCVFPMIPILSSIIVGEGENITPHRAFILSLTYVLAMSITYTSAGVLTGLLGENLQALFQNPWIIGSFSALLVILALSMFGLFELQLPHALQHHLHQIGHQQQGGKLVRAAVMGLLSALIVGPCLAPPLAGALIIIGQHGDPVLGGSALFALSMGMGLPLLAIGTSAGTLLPNAGDWMNNIKVIFGILMLAVAIWMLERIIPGWIGLLLWGSLSIVTAVYLGALNTLQIDSSGWERLWKGLGLILFIYGGTLLIGGISGNHDVWRPLQMITTDHSDNQRSSPGLVFTQVANLTDLNQQLDQSNQPAMLDFYADWCIDCKTMEATTFKDAKIKQALAEFTILQVDVTKNTDEHQTLLKHFGDEYWC